VAEIEALERLGADIVVPEEFETSIEIFARVLRLYGVPGDVIERGGTRSHFPQAPTRDRSDGHSGGARWYGSLSSRARVPVPAGRYRGAHW
jgi:CPA2 family monovalent cation:H+ antiporter-2